MAFRKKTLRTMSPTARKVARLIGEQESVVKRLKNLIKENYKLSANDLIKIVFADLLQFKDNFPQNDDMTIIIFKHEGTG